MQNKLVSFQLVVPTANPLHGWPQPQLNSKGYETKDCRRPKAHLNYASLTLPNTDDFFDSPSNQKDLLDDAPSLKINDFNHFLKSACLTNIRTSYAGFLFEDIHMHSSAPFSRCLRRGGPPQRLDEEEVGQEKNGMSLSW